MNAFALSGFILSFTCLFLGILILRAGTNKVHLIFALQNLSIAIWGFGCGFVGLSTTPELAYFWWKVAHIGGFFIIAFLLHHALLISNLERKWLLFISYALAAILPILFFTDLIGIKMRYVFNSLYYPQPINLIYPLYGLAWLGIGFYTTILMVRLYRKTNEVALKIYAIAYAFAIWGGGSYFLPVYGVDFYYPYGNFILPIYSIVMTYAILQHRLLDIEVIIRKTLVFAGLLVAILVVIILPVLLVQERITGAVIAYLTGKFFITGKINFYGLSNLFAMITNLAIALFLYIKVHRSRLARIWAYFTFCVAIYGYGAFMASGAKNYDSAFFWWQISYVGVILLPALFTNFVYTFLEIKKTFLVKMVYVSTAVIWISNIFSKELFIGHVKKVFIDSQWFAPAWFVYPPGPLHIFHTFVLYFLLLMFLFMKLIQAYKNSDQIKQVKIKYFTIAMILGFSGGGSSYLPCFGIDIYPIPNIAVPLYTLLIAYAIIRHRLMDVEIIVEKTVVFTGLLLAVITILVLPTVFVQGFLLRDPSTTGKFIGLAIGSVIIVLTMRRIEGFLVKATDKYLFQKKYDYKELLKVFTTEVLTVLELNKLVNLTVEKLSDIMRLDSCAVLLLNKTSDKLEVSAKNGVIMSVKELPNFEDIRRSTSGYLKLSKHNAVIPLTLNNNIIGALLLGKKKSDDSYTQDDMDILLPLAKTLAIAISNAELFTELGKTQAEAAQKEKMAVIGTLAAGMAHEIRNPITTIKIFAEYLKEKKDDPLFLEKFEKLVPREVEKINHMITSLLEFSKPADGALKESVNIKQALAEVVDILGNEMVLNDIILEERIGDIAHITGNKKHIQEILFNIIENAIHAIGRRGSISVSAEDAHSFVLVSIKDSGRGIPEENIKQIFEPFFTTKMNEKGVGLGLYVIKQLMLRMDGNIEVYSKVGEGTTFKLYFKKA